MPPKPPNQKNGVQNGGASKKPFRTIQKTEDMLRGNAHAKRRGQGREKAVLKGLHDLVKATKNLPGSISVERFAETRALEIAALQNAIKLAKSQSTSRAFQSLPRHLRRRAASHNPCRVPKRLRSRAASEIDPGDMTVKIHRKKAKLRARGDLRGRSRTMQLRARQVNKRWLGTHIFHAKRFHMTNIWGYRIPKTPTLKSFRASYRAARRKAIVQDTSFVGTIELEGPHEQIVALLSKITAGGAFTGSKYDAGMRVAHANVYHYGTFPLGLIGPTDILWQPATEDGSSRKVWLRLHPSTFNEVWETITTAVTANPEDLGALLIHDLRDSLESFELTGPLAGQVLSRSLRVCNSEPSDKKRAILSLLHADPEESPDRLVVGFKVYDPRLSFPPTKHFVDGSRLLQSPWETLQTPSGVSTELWDADVRSGLSQPRWKKADLDARRNQLGLPGSRLDPAMNDDRVPVILLRTTIGGGTPGQEEASFHGWTLIIPHGWSMAFLPSFVYCNAKLGGIVERRNRCREAGVPSFPEHYSSVCNASEAWELQQSQEDQLRWLRKPPGKRPEFSTLRTRWPFRPVWSEVLARDSKTSEEEAAINGDAQRRVWLFNSALAPCITQLAAAADPSKRLLEIVNAFRQRRGLAQLPCSVATELFESALCHVQVEMVSRGSPSDMATISDMSDLERKDWDRYLVDHRSTRPQGRGQYSTESMVCPPLCPRLTSQMCMFPPPPGLTPGYETRVIGFATAGNISLTRGAGHALAMVSLAGYLRLVATAQRSAQPELILAKVKNRDGHIYRLASLTLVQ